MLTSVCCSCVRELNRQPAAELYLLFVGLWVSSWSKYSQDGSEETLIQLHCHFLNQSHEIPEEQTLEICHIIIIMLKIIIIINIKISLLLIIHIIIKSSETISGSVFRMEEPGIEPPTLRSVDDPPDLQNGDEIQQ